MTFPQRISFITLGARDVALLRGFYRALGWQERPGSNDKFAAFDAGTVRLALYPIRLLGAEAAPGEAAPDVGWNGVTLAVNVSDTKTVDDVFQSAVAAGARAIADPVVREWGGYSAYIADPEGNRWEIAWAPDM